MDKKEYVMTMITLLYGMNAAACDDINGCVGRGDLDAALRKCLILFSPAVISTVEEMMDRACEAVSAGNVVPIKKNQDDLI